MKHPDDSVGRVFFTARRSSYPKTTDIDGNWFADYVGYNLSGYNNPGIRAFFSGTVFSMIPDKRCAVGIGFDIQKQQRIFRFNGQFFQKWIVAIIIDAVNSYKPGVFSIEYRKFPFVFLNGRMAKGHVVGDRVK